MKFYRSSIQFYHRKNNGGTESTGSEDVPVNFPSVEAALKDITDWISKYRSSIDVNKPEITKMGNWTTYKWQGSFEMYGKITDVVSITWDHTQEETDDTTRTS